MWVKLVLIPSSSYLLFNIEKSPRNIHRVSYTKTHILIVIPMRMCKPLETIGTYTMMLGNNATPPKIHEKGKKLKCKAQVQVERRHNPNGIFLHFSFKNDIQ